MFARKILTYDKMDIIYFISAKRETITIYVDKLCL